MDALQASDLVRRLADPGDRRATLVEVTEHGADVLAEIRATRGPEAGRASPPSARPTAPNWPASSASSGIRPRQAAALADASVHRMAEAAAHRVIGER